MRILQAQIRTLRRLGERARLDELIGPVIFLAWEAGFPCDGRGVLAVDGGYVDGRIYGRCDARRAGLLRITGP